MTNYNLQFAWTNNVCMYHRYHHGCLTNTFPGVVSSTNYSIRESMSYMHLLLRCVPKTAHCRLLTLCKPCSEPRKGNTFTRKKIPFVFTIKRNDGNTHKIKIIYKKNVRWILILILRIYICICKSVINVMTDSIAWLTVIKIWRHRVQNQSVKRKY